MYKVLVKNSDNTIPRVNKLKEKYKDVTFEVSEITESNIKDANVLVSWWLDKEILDEAKVLEAIFVPMTGTNAFPEKEISERKIELVNTHAKSKYIAERGFALLLDTLGKVSKTDHIFRTQDKWANRSYTDFWTSLFDKKVGFYGFGSIGKKMSSFFAPFDCEICTLSRHKSSGGADKYFDTLSDLAEYCDILIVSTPLNDETVGSVNLDILKKLGGFVVNVGRGSIIDEEALYKALKDGHLKGAGSDVWYIYPTSTENLRPSKFAFEELDNIVMSPHTAWSTYEEPDALIDDIFDKIDKFLEKKFL